MTGNLGALNSGYFAIGRLGTRTTSLELDESVHRKLSY